MSKALQWTLRVAGLVAVAVVSGLVWYYVVNDSQSTATNTSDESTTPEPEGVYKFTPHEDMPKPQTDKDCEKHSYDDIKAFFKETPCDHLSQQLFVTEVDGRTVYTSVSVVTMPDEAKAAALRKLTDTDDTGNVNDVVRDGEVTIEGLDRLSGGGGYDATQNGRDVTIVEADFDPKDASGDEKKDEDEILDPVCQDALLLSAQVVDSDGEG
jgi:hypothetical protein